MKSLGRFQAVIIIGSLGCAALAGVGFLLGGGLPGPGDLHPGVRGQPVQVEAPAAPYPLEREGRPYRIEPVATYDITALIVSRNNLDEETENELGLTRDIGVIWGSNTQDGRYLDYEFSSSSWMLRVRVPHGVPFNMAEMANIHLVTATDQIADTIDSLEPGAQVRLQGKLINYVRTDLGSFKRMTSLTRDDTGNGACEILLVEHVDVIANPNAKYVTMSRIGGWGLLCGFILLIGVTLFGAWQAQANHARGYAP